MTNFKQRFPVGTRVVRIGKNKTQGVVVEKITTGLEADKSYGEVVAQMMREMVPVKWDDDTASYTNPVYLRKL